MEDGESDEEEGVVARDALGPNTIIRFLIISPHALVCPYYFFCYIILFRDMSYNWQA